jgi:hypothetical protein
LRCNQTMAKQAASQIGTAANSLTMIVHGLRRGR